MTRARPRTTSCRSRNAPRQTCAKTHSYPSNTLLGLPTELPIIVYQFALQDVVDSIVHESSSERHGFRYQSTPCLGGLALPLINRTMRKESLDVYGPMVKARQQQLWDNYTGLQNMALQLPVRERFRDLNDEFDAYLRWRAVGRLLRVVNCMYINECYVRGYYGELHEEARVSEWRARV